MKWLIGNGATRVLGLAVVLLFWLLPHQALQGQWNEGEGHRWRSLSVPASPSAGLERVEADLSGLYFTNMLSRSRYMTNQIYLNGSGVTAGDVDGDERVDVFFAGLDGKNRLFRNLGEWRFEDITDQAGVGAALLASTGCALADIDGDADLDLLVNTVGQGTHLFTNDGKGRFTWQTQRRAPNGGRGGMSLALADVDGDADLDLYLANYRTWTYRDHPRPKIRGDNVNGKPVVVSFNGRPTTEPDLVGRFSLTENNKILENGELDAFFLNDGKGRFRQVPFHSGTFLDEAGQPWRTRPFDWGLSVMFRDMDGDLAPELYVCNDFSAPDRVWQNLGDGRFQLMPALALRNTSRFSMGIDFADLDRDGHDDFVVMDMLSRSHERRMVQMGDPPQGRERGDEMTSRPQFSRNTLYRNRGDGTYAEVAYWAGTHAAEWAWTPVFVDLDLDGFEDLLVTNGHERDALNADVRMQIEGQLQDPKLSRNDILLLSNLYARLDTGNVAFRNRGDFSFEDVSEQWGFGGRAVSHGMALADLDNDGDQDVLVNNLNGPAGVFRNVGSEPRVAVRLRGVAPNTFGIGAKIQFIGAPQNQSQEVIAGGRYLSSDDPMRVFACAADSEDAVIEVRWRSGRVSRVENIQANRLYEIREPDGVVDDAADEKPEVMPLFADVSSSLAHSHREVPFDDFFRQPMLPKGLSELGPGVLWADLNQDGFDDLIVGSGRGGQMAVLHNLAGKSFRSYSSGKLNPIQSRDQVGLASWQTKSEGVLVVSAAANYEDGSASGVAVSLLRADERNRPQTLKATRSSLGPIAASDFDGDGDVDLFTGGRVVPGQYPSAADSQLWLNEGGNLKASSLNETLFAKLGLVSGAVWSDLKGDGFPELVVACEWGRLRVFNNEEGRLSESTGDWKLNERTGWWQGITAGDFDGDGRMDLVASNWGRNHSYQPMGAENLRWFAGQLAPNRPFEILEGYVDEIHAKAVPSKGFGLYSQTFSGARERFRTYARFGQATIEDVLGDRLGDFQQFQVNTFGHTLLLNRGDHFETRELPWLCQLAPGFALAVADVNLDGNEDLFLSQNFFHVRPEMSRMDAGRGTLLLGDGSGDWEVISGDHSGITVYGEGRGAAFGDYNRDGRPDLAVAQNGARTRLFQNQSKEQGIRVRLQAGEGNLTAVGAVIRMGRDGQFGPAREVHAGAGYWSQNSPVQVFASGSSEIKVRWPGGNETVSPVPAGAREILVDAAGMVTVPNETR